MNTKKFRQRTIVNEKNNGTIEGHWLIGADIGYSACKIFSPNKFGGFPTFAKRLPKDFDFFGPAPDNAILYRSADGEIFAVGEYAQNLVEKGDTSYSDNLMFGRDRYMTDIFRIATDVSLAFGIKNTSSGKQYNGEEIYVQTGLPERYLSDTEDLKAAIAGKHVFSMRVGGEKWVDYKITVKEENIDVISQPRGTLFSVCIDNKGQFIPEAEKYMKSSVIVFDAGFGTLDIFGIRANTKGALSETFNDLGMKRVFQETAALIKGKYNEDVSVSDMQRVLEEGFVRHLDRKNRSSSVYQIEELLDKACMKVCEEAITRLESIINISQYDYIVITGGTSAAWKNKLESLLSRYYPLKVLYGNQNDNLPMTYSNVRGYYLYRFNLLQREIRTKG